MRTSGAVGQRLCCGLVAALVLMTAGNEVLHADDAELRDCTPDDLKEWRWKRGAQVGVHVIDPHRNLIPTAVATDLCAESVDFALDQDGRASDGIHGWVLAAGCKQATCGWPASFEHNTAMSRFTAEHDLNHNIIPEASHLTSILGQRSCFPHQWTGAQSKWATTSVRRNAPAYDDPYLCFPPNSTIHVEITPPQGLRSHLRNYWMDESDRLAWRRRLAYGQYCAYGPFVADTGHGAKAEIHPAERFWWNENTARVEVKEGGSGALSTRRPPTVRSCSTSFRTRPRVMSGATISC